VLLLIKGITSSPADPAMQGARPGPARDPSRLHKILSLLQVQALFQVFYGSALFEEFVGTDPLDWTHFVCIFLAGIYDILILRNVL